MVGVYQAVNSGRLTKHRFYVARQYRQCRSTGTFTQNFVNKTK